MTTELHDLEILYVCTDFPYPPINGGLVDMWNRILALRDLGVTVDLIVTVATEPDDSARRKVANCVRRLIFSRRARGIRGLFSVKAGQAAIRRDLRDVELIENYDVVLMQTEFVSEILNNRTLSAKATIIRVDNDEHAYYLQTGRAERSWIWKLFYFQEAVRVRNLSSRILPIVDMLWFVSHDELERYNSRDVNLKQSTAFVPTAIDLRLLGTPSLEGNQVLFVGNLWATLNREALEWYIHNVHPKLCDIPGYQFLIAGSTRGRGCSWLDSVISQYPNIEVHLDAKDLEPFYASSAIFVNPMQNGAGVKLKTIEAVVRGLPVVSTRVGVEGSGLVKDVHYKPADEPDEFATQVRELLRNRESAHEIVRNAQSFVVDRYDQRKVVGSLLLEAVERAGAHRQEPKKSTPVLR